MENINWLDLLVICILGLFALKGIFNGFIAEITGILSVALGIYFASSFCDTLAVHLLPYAISLGIASSYITVLSFVLILFLVIVVIAMLAKMVQKFLKATFTKWVDHLLGAVAGLAKGYLIVAVLTYFLLYFLPNATVVKTSLTMPYLIVVGDFLLGSLNLIQ